ncbi:hypothetical protein B9Z55_022117 [Caenorhabditis nigoni]|uniref:ELM2 domain-containing protein n=1 Tax=Caenorhabditis nigoni TaxID=1611254 RepID=A0A2G5TVX8_9PELO|nr:hypothetical protein B9Z55_022117 [Caenorhabditis nigoni]
MRLEDDVWRKLWEQENSISDKNHEWRKKVKEEAEKFGKNVNARINVGPNFQALLNEEGPTHTFGEDYPEDQTRSEVIFNPNDREETWNEVCPKIRRLNEDAYYDWSRNIYWRAIYRQFEGRITFEAALQHLQQCGFDFGYALDTIDRKLLNAPQETRSIPAGQVKTIASLMVKPEVTRREMQASAMRNWHLPEIQMFREQFIRFYSRQASFGVGCNCNDPVYMDVAFEPRVGCFVCTKHRRPHADSSKKCLICLTYGKIFEHERPAKQVIFLDTENDFLNKWTEKEARDNRSWTREEMEQWLIAEDEKRWRELDLTEEECDMLNIKQSEESIKAKKRGGHVNEEKKREKGEQMIRKLKPFKLPFFTKCSCRESGFESREFVDPIKDPKKRKEPKKSWSEEEQIHYRDLLIEHNGDLRKVGAVLDVEPGLVGRFATTYNFTHPIWQGKIFPRISTLFRQPDRNKPTPIPRWKQKLLKGPFMDDLVGILKPEEQRPDAQRAEGNQPMDQQPECQIAEAQQPDVQKADTNQLVNQQPEPVKNVDAQTSDAQRSVIW